MNEEFKEQPALADQDMTATQGFENPDRSQIKIQFWQCPHCLKPFNEPGRLSNRVNVITKLGKEQWCGACTESGIKEGICYKEQKLSKAEKKQVKKEKFKTLKFLKQQKKEVEQNAKAKL